MRTCDEHDLPTAGGIDEMLAPGLWRKLPAHDDTDWLMLPYSARGLYLQLWRKLDDDGRLDLGRYGLRGVCAHVGTPADWPVIQPDLQTLLDAGAVIFNEAAGELEVPDFKEAQGAYVCSPEAERKRKARELGRTKPDAIGTCPDMSGTSHTEENKKEKRREENASPETHAKTPPPAHVAAPVPDSRPVSGQLEAIPDPVSPTRQESDEPPKASARRSAGPKQAAAAQQPSLAGLDAQTSQAAQEGDGSKKLTRNVAHRMTEMLLVELSQARRRVDPKLGFIGPSEANVKHIRERLMEGTTVEEIRHVIAVFEARSRHSSEALEYFNARSPFLKDNIAIWTGMSVEQAARPRSKPGAMPQPGKPEGHDTDENVNPLIKYRRDKWK